MLRGPSSSGSSPALSLYEIAGILQIAKLGSVWLAQVYIRMYMKAMSKRYSIAEARSHLPSLVDEAESGQEIELTRRGKPVAVLLSLREVERLRGERTGFGDAYRRFLKTHRLSEVGLDEEEIGSIRDRSAGRKVAL